MAKSIGKHKSHHGGKGPHLHHHGKHHFKRGGRTHGKIDGLPQNSTDHPDQAEHEHAKAYNAAGSHVMKEGHKKTAEFKCGGKVMGNKSKARMDKFARGGRAGGSPFSSAAIKENTASAPHRHKSHGKPAFLKTGLNPGGE